MDAGRPIKLILNSRTIGKWHVYDGRIIDSKGELDEIRQEDLKSLLTSALMIS